MTGSIGREPLGDLGDAALAARIAAGDERALMTAYDRHGDALFGIAVRFLADREAAAEIVQEAFMTLWQRAERYDERAGSLLGWLVGITRFRALDRLRRESRRPRLVAPLDPTADDGERLARAAVAGGAVEVDDPAEALDRRWTRSVVRAALSEMPVDQREVLVLAYDQGLTQAEIAERTGLPIGTVKSRTRRGLAALRERLVAVPELRA